MWAWIKQSFHDSEVIVFARLQVFAGVLLGIVHFALPIILGLDLSGVIQNPKVFVLWMLFSGLLTEYLRRLRTDFGKETIFNEADNDSNSNVAG